MTVDRSDAVNLARNIVTRTAGHAGNITPKGVQCLAEAVLRMDAALRTSPEEASAPMSCRAFSGPEQFAAYCVAKGQREERSEWSVAYDLWLKELSRYMNKEQSK